MVAAVTPPVAIPPPSSRAQMDAQLGKLRAKAPEFAALPLAERRGLLREMRDRVAELAEEWVRRACAAKGVDFHSPLSGEEWLAGPFITIRNFRLVDRALEEISERGQPVVRPGQLRRRANGGLAVEVFPTSMLDKALFAGINAETYLTPGVTAEQMRERQAGFYKHPHHAGVVSLILGAGNVASIPPTDVASKLFNEGKVCVLKMNPVNAYLGPLFEQVFARCIERGYVALSYGGADEGRYLVEHRDVDEVHITGSDRTHDAMVWGPPGPEREARKARNEPLLHKEITSELGNVSPVIVVPGPYTADELAFQSANIAGAVTNNASFNCNAAKLLVSPKGWSQRQPLLAGIADQLEHAPLRRAYYPGATERWHAFTDGRSGVKLLGHPAEGELPWTLIEDVDAANADEKIFRDEPFCSILSETAVGSDDPVRFLKEAVSFVNSRVWGTLNATVIVHPKVLEDRAMAAALEQALEDLNYGAIGVNLWPASIFALGSAPWGGAPGASLQDIQSGRGFVHNSFMLEDIQKCVARAPLTSAPKPLWFPGHNTAHVVGRALVKLEVDHSWVDMPAVGLAALRG